MNFGAGDLFEVNFTDDNYSKQLNILPFNNDIVKEVNLEVGYKFTANRFHFGYAYHFHTNKLNNLRFDKGNDYGKLFFNYLFR